MTKSFLISALLLQIIPILSNSYAASAPDLPGHCLGADVQSVERKFNGSSKSFSYRFRWIRKAEAGFPTVIFIPGGPGQTSMEGNQIQPSTVPQQIGLVLTDPRGTGCNYHPDFDAIDFQTSLMTQDLLSILEKLKIPNSNVILYGVSFGTLLATTVAHHNQMLGKAPFQKLVLEGTIGKYFKGAEYFEQFAQVWEHEMSVKGDEFRRKIARAVVENRVDAAKFASFLNGYLMLGGWGKSRASVLDEVLNLLLRDFASFQSDLFGPALAQPLDNPQTRMQSKLKTVLWCREISDPGDGQRLAFENGKLVVRPDSPGSNPSPCGNARPNALYDSSQYLISEPIVYLQGSQDPATSVQQMRFHFANQVKSQKRTLLLFHEMGHAPSMTIHLISPGTMQFLWLSNFEPQVAKDRMASLQIEMSSEIRKGL